ncbi:MFS transporter [Quisquiliibacterium transsilvanicum]|uniref:Na+/melibiose symporter-like transporter n=1 Tax=Quisquiliibacterium transsilvanicum TaxID=1549638 RepID=A0A7W8HKX8_9BURK|nr:MFS transporter [Quisquiliibacterium transsilvanicum]MBB5273757.1 Na+/melibiose symporter-like transporter [Quisquiliibacterium transsilvanicum]
MIAALTPFRTRSFRFQWPADLCTAWALEMETLILGWYVLVESGSVMLLTIFGALQFVGTLVAPMLGVVGDRIGLRNLLALMRISYAVFAGALLFLALTDRLTPWAVLVVSGLCGLVRPSDIGMRSALVGATVPAPYLVSAMGISRMTMDSAKIGGALAGAGFMAAFGMAPAYVMIVAIHLAGVALTLMIDGGRAAPPTAQARPSPWRDLAEGLGYVWRTPAVLAAMAVATLVNLTAYPLSIGLLPYIARDVLALDQTGLGWLAASYAFGALVGSVLMSLFGATLRPARIMLGAALAWYVLLAGFVLSASAPIAMALLAASGAAQSFSMLAVAIMLLRSTGAQMRGRIMGVRMLAIYTLPVGMLIAGAAIPLTGYHAAALAMLAAGALMLATIAWRWRTVLLPRTAPANGG